MLKAFQRLSSGVKYTLVSYYLVSETTFDDDQSEQTVSHLGNSRRLQRTRWMLEQSSPSLLADSAASAIPGSWPVDLSLSNVHPNADSWAQIFEQTSCDHWPSTWNERGVPLQRYRLSFGNPSQNFEGIPVVTRRQAADTASEKSADSDYTSLTLIEHGHILRNGGEDPSRPLVSIYDWQTATSQDLERLENLWKTRDKGHAIRPVNLKASPAPPPPAGQPA
jgi:hypothetical protein